MNDEGRGNASREASRGLDDRGCDGDSGLSAFERRIHPRHHCGGGGSRNCGDGVVGFCVIIVSVRIACSVRGV